VPLVLRFAKGAIHSIIIIPVFLHSIFTVFVVYLDRYITGSVGVPSTIIPSLSIVVGLMLVFRNGTSYDRFWTGRNCLTTIGTSVRNLARAFLVSARAKGDGLGGVGKLTDAEKADTEKIIRVLVAILYAVKNNLRAEFNIPPASLLTNPPPPSSRPRSRATSRRPSLEDGFSTPKAEYSALLPDGLMGYEDQGLGLPLQLTVLVESYIRRGFERGWFHGPQASQMTVQVNGLVDAYGRMETIRTTPIPVAHL
jgi:putative membrane protein